MIEGNPFVIPILPDFDEPEITKVREKPKTSAEVMPTIFDVERYFIDTGREYFIDSVGELNTKKIENALMDDLDKAESPEKRKKLRALIQVAVTNGYLKPELTHDDIKELVHGRIRNLHWEYMRKMEAGDDAENEEYLMAGWRRILLLMSTKNEVMDDEEMLFIEELLREMGNNLRQTPYSRIAQDVYEKLRKIRTTMYFKAFNKI
ncbi:MAG: hypothetical protein P1P90_00695 [Patescibacteria group bacterium]|nr:hypothetical protein [Patescibacteria group bacterium]